MCHRLSEQHERCSRCFGGEKLKRHMKLIIRILTNRDSNLRSHVKFFISKAFHRNIHLVDEVIFGRNSSILAKKGNVTVGDYLRLSDGTVVSAISGNVKIGNSVFINRNCSIVCRKHIEIGDMVSIGPNVTIWDHDHNYDNSTICEAGYKTGEIIIEKECWIGAGAIILRNTRIGEGSVVGAGTVIKGDIPPHSLVTSNRELIIKPIQKRKEI